MPVTRAPSVARDSARMPPPQPTSSTRLPPNPLNTARKYCTRAVLSSGSPANGPTSLHHRPGMRSTRRSYFSGSERPPRRGSWSDMRDNLRRWGGWGRFGRLGRWWRSEGLVQLPRGEPGAALTLGQGAPVLAGEQSGLVSEPQRVSDFAQLRERDVEETTEFLGAASRRSLDDIDGGGERRTPEL